MAEKITLNVPALCIDIKDTKDGKIYVIRDMNGETFTQTKVELLAALGWNIKYVINLSLTKDNRILLTSPNTWNLEAKKQYEKLISKDKLVRMQTQVSVDTENKIIKFPSCHGKHYYLGIAKLLSEGYTYNKMVSGYQEGYSHNNFKYNQVTMNTSNVWSCVMKAYELTKESSWQHYEMRKNEGDFND